MAGIAQHEIVGQRGFGRSAAQLAQRQRPLERRPRGAEDVGAYGLFAGALIVVGGAVVLTGLNVVFGDEAQVFADALPGVVFQPAGDAAVELGAILQQHRLIGHVAQQGVLEEVLAGPGEGGALLAEDQLAAAGGLQRDGHLVAPLPEQVGHRVVPEQAADHRRPL